MVRDPRAPALQFTFGILHNGAGGNPPSSFRRPSSYL